MSRPVPPQPTVAAVRSALIATALLMSTIGLLAPAANATLDAPLKLRLQDGRLAARAGEVYNGVLEVVIPSELEHVPQVTNLRIESPSGWRDVVLSAAKAGNLGQPGVHAVPFSALVDDPTQPLVVVVDIDGRTVGRSFVMSEEAIRDRTSPVRLEQLPGSTLVGFPGMDGSMARPELPEQAPAVKDPASQGMTEHGESQPGASPDGLQDPTDPARPDRDRSIRVFGRFAYRRTDNQMIGVDGAVARVYDDDWCCDELLAQVTTDPFGYFDVTFNWDPCWTCDGEPDIYVEFELDNSVVQVQTDDLLEEDYTFESGTWNNYGGNSLNVGTQVPSDWLKMASCHIHTSIVRAWRWILNLQGRNVPQVDVQWPSGDKGAKYNDFFEEIHISGERSWSEYTHIHEYGHHFVENFAILNSPDYCNGSCDDAPNAWWPFESCGHCFWCGETNHDAFNEGFPNWMGDVITRSFAADYPPGALADNPGFYQTRESWMACTNGGSSDPYITEGAFAGLLLDMTDGGTAQDDDPGQAWGRDVMTLPTQDIFNLVDWDHPTNPADFLDKFRARWPGQTENLWQTARNNGYDFDTQQPGVVGNLRAPNHFLGGQATRVTLDVAFDRAPDDAAGVDAYSYLVTTAYPPMPDTSPELGNVTSFTYPTALTPGWYWIAVRARDRAGKWSDNYAVQGPYGVRSPDPADLMMVKSSLWNYHSVVPKPAPDAPWPPYSMSAPDILWGNDSGLWQAPLTYLNVNYWNQGEVTSGAPFFVSMFADAAILTYHLQGTGLAPHGIGWTPVIDHPMPVRGGRHTIGARVDDTELLAEPNETNNHWARQWGFTAQTVLSDNVLVSQPAPPLRYGGTDWIVDGSPVYENSSGFVLAATEPWTAIAMYGGGAADFDMRLHSYDQSPYSAFGPAVGYSGRLSGQLDALFVNANTVGWQYWNVGIVNWSSSWDWFGIRKIVSGVMPYGQPVQASFADGELLKLWQVTLASGQNGNISVTADLNDPSQGPVYLAWLNSNFGVGGLYDAAATAISDPVTGRIALTLSGTQAGNHCLVAYRDPGLPNAKRATGPVTLTMTVSPELPDVIPYAGTGWAAPLVPRAAIDTGEFNVPAPATLVGDVQSYLNVSVHNVASSTPLFVNTGLNVDGTTQLVELLYDVPGWFNGWSLSIPRVIPGGRHVLSMAVDVWDDIWELAETNNIYGAPWVYRPQTMTPNVITQRATLADVTSGWDQVTTGETLWPTCDGVRTPVIAQDANFHGAWGAVAVLGTDASMDFDVTLHEASTGAKDGFTIPLVTSAWGSGQTDYVLVNSNLTAPREFDAAITRTGLGGTLSHAQVEYVPSTFWSTANGVHGPYAMTDLLDLYEVVLGPGNYTLRLRNIAGTIDWGMTVHRDDLAFQTKGTALPGAVVNYYGGGQDESVLLNIGATGRFAIAVWKSAHADAAAPGTYELILSPDATAAPGLPAALPVTTALRGAHPNPFNPRTSIAFDVAQPGSVRVDVYTLRGQLVRTLANEVRAVGRHEVAWQGDDAAGHAVASGVYLVRMSGPGAVDQLKIVLAK